MHARAVSTRRDTYNTAGEINRLVSRTVLVILVFHADRTTPIGHMINGFLQNTTDIDDRCVHLLFSANRWEAE